MGSVKKMVRQIQAKGLSVWPHNARTRLISRAREQESQTTAKVQRLRGRQELVERGKGTWYHFLEAKISDSEDKPDPTRQFSAAESAITTRREGLNI